MLIIGCGIVIALVLAVFAEMRHEDYERTDSTGGDQPQ